MTEIALGDLIAIDGKPDWYRGEQVQWIHGVGLTSRAHEWNDKDWAVVAREGGFRLPADHPYYLATSRGFTYWPGGDSAPADWDGGAILFRNGEESGGGEPFWAHNFGIVDVIGYRKRTEQPAPAIAPELVERMVSMVRWIDDEGGAMDIAEVVDEARAILAELEPGPVQRFKRANPGLSPDELLAKALGVGE